MLVVVSTIKTKSVFIRFLSYVRPYWFMIGIASTGGVVKFTVPMIFPQIMRYFIDVVLNPNSVMTTAARLHELTKWSLIIIGLYVFIWTPFTYVRHYYAGKVGNRVIFDLRYHLYLHIQRMSATYYNQNQSGGIVSRLMSDIALAQNMVGNALTNIWMDGAVVIVLLVIMLRMDPVLTLVSLSIFPFYILATKRLGKLVKENSRMVQDEIQEMASGLQEKIAGYTVVQAFAREKFEQIRFFKEARKLLVHTIRTVQLSTINVLIVGVLTAIAPVLVIWVSGQRILSGHLTIGEMVVFYSYLGQFYLPINRFSELNVIFSTSLAAIERVFEVFDQQTDVIEKVDALEFDRNMRGEVSLQNVTFSYDKGSKVLKNVNLTVIPGQKVAIVGSSGSGKSTLISLIPRFYDPEEGRICIDGEDIRNYKLRSLRQNIGMVLQDTILFSGSLRENIAYGNPKVSEKEIIKAAMEANAYEFIQQLPYGLNTEVGERGVKLSGGQKQRIAITRAFIRNPKILILDEATSSLDSESENLIQEALDRLMKGRTTFIIAHRLSTIINADFIVVVDQGEIKETGTHEELIAIGGIYKHLFDEQFRDIVETMTSGES